MVLTRLQELEGFVHCILLFTVCTRNCPNTLASTTTPSGAHSGSPQLNTKHVTCVTWTSVLSQWLFNWFVCLYSLIVVLQVTVL